MYVFLKEGQPDYTKSVLFDNSKRELFSPSSGYKTLQTRLKVHWSVGIQQQDITLERLAGSKLVVFGGPREKFSVAEVELCGTEASATLTVSAFSLMPYENILTMVEAC